MEVSGQFHDPAASTPVETAPGTHWIGGSVGPKDCFDAVEMRNISFLWQESNRYHLARSTFLYPLSYPGFTTHYRYIIDFVKTDIKQCNLQTMNKYYESHTGELAEHIGCFFCKADCSR
jgi:hypothetical protein